jgi:hypothetical protein
MMMDNQEELPPASHRAAMNGVCEVWGVLLEGGQGLDAWSVTVSVKVITWDYLGSVGITWDYLGLLGITWDYLGLITPDLFPKPRVCLRVMIYDA